MCENTNEVFLTKILEIQVNSFCHLDLKPNECMPRRNGNSPETHPVMSSPSSLSYLLSPRSRLVSTSGQSQAKLQRLPLLFSENCCGLYNVLLALSFPLALSVPSAVLCSHVPPSVRGKYDNEETDGILFVNSNLFRFPWWQVLEWILC